MRNIILFLIGICAISCNNSNDDDMISIKYYNFEVIEIDSCEYLIGYCFNRGYMAHKGNCKYCIKRYNYGTMDSKR